MLVHQLLEWSSMAVVLGHRAEAATVAMAKKIYFPWTHEGFRVRMDNSLRNGFQLGTRRVSPLEGSIEGPDGIKHVQPKVMDVLLCLARQAGQVVERDAIVDEVWDGRPTSDEVLTRCVSELRNVLSDEPDRPAYIQTIPKRGYRLVANVVVDPVHSSATTGITQDTAPHGFLGRQLQDLRKRKVFQTVIGYPVLSWILVQILDVLWTYLLQPLGAPRWLVPSIVVLLALGYPIAVFLSWALDITPQGMRLTKRHEGTSSYAGLIVVGLATVAITAGALFAYFNAYDTTVPARSIAAETPTYASPMRRSIAVLRFINISENLGIGYLGDGLTEELIHELTNLKSIKVAARTSVWPYSTSDLHVTEIAKRLGVEKVLEGSIRADGNQIRVTAQLIGEDGFHLWSDVYERDLDDMLAIQKDIATQVVRKLGVLLSDESEVRLAQQPTIDSSAYDKYLQGRQFLREPSNPETLGNAQRLFEEAIQLDNRFPLAFAGLCETHLANYRLTRTTEYFEHAEIACHRALTLDGGLAEVYTALGDLYRHFGQYIKAEQEYHTALGINPMLEAANFGLGRSYQAQGRLAEAEETLRRSIQMEPDYWGAYLGLGNFLNRLGRFEESVPYYQKVTEIAPGYVGGYINLGSSLHWLGQWDEAEVVWGKALELRADAVAYQNMGSLYYYQHRFPEALAMHEKAVEIAPSDHRGWGKLASAQRSIDGYENAFRETYERAIELVNEQLAVNPDEAENLWFLAAYLSHLGDLAGASQAIERAVALAPESPSVHYFAALLDIHAGNHGNAVIKLEKAAGFGYSLRLIGADPDFEILQDDDRFQALIKINN